LVVDDNKDAADTLARLVQMQGHEVRAAYHGLTGLQIALEWKPNAVILDIGLPGMSGIEVAERIRAQPMPHKVLLIALTGYSELLGQLTAGTPKFDAAFAKPAEPEVLLDLLDAHAHG